EDPETRTKATVKTKQAIRKEFETELRKFCKPYLTYNPAVTADRENFGLPVHKTTRTPVPVATMPPDYELELSVPGRITFHFFEKGGKHAEAKPFGQHGAEIGWSLGGERPARWQDLSHSSFDTHSPLTLSFENDQRGQPLYFALRWENTRGEKGPWSEIQETMVP
ncbi:MAG: hypothetical protein LBF81_05165, partial [Prevotellaceae bacterium]|nr:hypothetical protein [Prevotellaceae bacterium]